MSRPARTRLAIGAVGALAAVALAGCATAAPASDSSAPAEPSHESDTRVAISYDGGILVLDGETLDTVDRVELGGFLRVNSAGDHDGHVFVTAEDGFHLLDTGLATDTVELTGEVFEAVAAGHVTPHGGRTALFDDGTGDIRVFDTDAVGAGTLPEVDTITSEAAHHGVAVELTDGTTLATIGTADARTGVRLLAQDGSEIARNEQCPSVHGEGALKGEAVMFGCEDGVLLFADGAFTKLDAPDAYGRTGNAYVTDTSAIAVGDYNADPDSEGYLLSQLALIDTDAQKLSVVDLPAGVQYTWRGVGRSAHDDIIVLGSDGTLNVLDETGAPQESWKVIAPWESPTEWQQPHPGLRVVGDLAYVTEPAANRILAVDLHSGEVSAEATLDIVPNEFTVVGAAGH
ncbi:MAG: hypothetical protein P0Y60_03110 [Candidatus Microbacterium colombiense]|nr:MAG: hypothetical protein P0Y60_03110 [Microbacterium sp.]